MAAVGLTAACARQGAPPGGPEDRRPPVVVATRPDTFAVVEDFSGPVEFIFDERISERVTGGLLNGAVLVSPRTGEVEVGHGRGALEVSLAGGFRPGLVYRVTLLPVVSDLFGNQMRDPFELVFSTGGEMVPSAVAGLAWDRATGRGVGGLQVLARDTRDSTVYVARTDTGGIYAFRYLPPGPYQVTAFQDRNADDEVDPMEVQGGQLLQVTGPDTIVTEIGVLQPDTTPARLVSAEVLDSTTLVLTYDEPLDPLAPVTEGNVSLAAVEMTDSAEVARGPEGDALVDESAPAPPLAHVFHEHTYRSWAAAARDSLTRLDSLDRARALEARRSGDTLRADSLAGRPPRPLPPALGRATQAGGRAAGVRTEAGDTAVARLGPDGRPLPSRRLVVVLGGPLVTNRGYQVNTTGVTNLSRVPLGGGKAVVVRQPPPPPDTAADSLATDSLAADSVATDSLAADSIGTPPDTTAPAPGGPEPDTAGAAGPDPSAVVPSPGDTLGVGPDSVAPPPDTLPPPPDTLRAVVSGPAP